MRDFAPNMRQEITMGEMMSFKRPDGGETQGYLARAGGVDFDLYRYDAAHAFFNGTSAAYDVDSTRQSWERMSVFLSERL